MIAAKHTVLSLKVSRRAAAIAGLSFLRARRGLTAHSLYSTAVAWSEFVAARRTAEQYAGL